MSPSSPQTATSQSPDPAAIAPPSQLRWSHPRINLLRYLACNFAFFNMGTLQGSFGPLIPLLESYYHLNYATVSIIFLTLIPGYLVAAVVTNHIYLVGGRRVIVLLSACLRLVSAIVAACHPPFAVVVSVMTLSGLGIALIDSTLNVYVGNMTHAHELLGIMHGVFGLGCTVGQAYAAVLLANKTRPWWYYYYLLIALHGVEILVMAIVFWTDGAPCVSEVSETGRPSSTPPAKSTSFDEEQAIYGHAKTNTPIAEPKEPNAREPEMGSVVSTPKCVETGTVTEEEHPVTTMRTPDSDGHIRTALRLMKLSAFHTPYARVTWLIVLFFGLEWGQEIALSGWNVTFMIKTRGARGFASTMTNMGFWVGFSLGRITLGFVTGAVGELRAVVAYLLIVLGSQTVYWLVDDFYVSAVAIGLNGFFLGPVFPAAIYILGRLLPSELHVTAMSFCMALGLGLGELLPFIAGEIAQHRGVKNVMPYVLAMVAATLLTWVILTLPEWKSARRTREAVEA